MVSNRDYKEEILKIIEDHGGKLTGFNYLKEFVNPKFHPTSLSENLKELSIQNKIIIQKGGNGRPTTYLLAKSHYGTKIKVNDLQISKIEKILDDNPFMPKEQKSYLVRCIMRIALTKIRNIPLGELSLELTDYYPMPKNELKDAKNHYMDIIKRNLKLLDEETRRDLINSFFLKDKPRDILKQAQNYLKIA